MPAPAVLAIVAVIVACAGASAQERGIEVQGGAGYLRDSGEGPSLPAVNAAAIGWIARSWGVGVRLTKGIGVDRFDAPIETGDRTILGPGNLRMWAVTLQWRAVARGTELNFGVGAGGHGYRYEEIVTGMQQRIRSRSGSGFIALDLLVGRRLIGPVHVDLHPFQPLVVIALKR